VEINVALDNFKRAYNDLINAIEEPKASEYQFVENADVTLRHYEVSSDIGTYRYFAKNEVHAKNLFRAEHGFNRIFINQAREIKTNVDNGKQL